MSRFPHRALLLIGTVHEQMGDYEKAVEAFLQAEPLIAREAEPRLMNVVLFDLAAAYVHLDRFTEAAPLVRQVQELAFRLGDDIDLGKLAWLRGRIAAGFGRLREAMGLLEEARRKFVAEGMLYDLALVLLEKAAVLLAQGQLSEARILAKELNETFKSKEIHREALAALRIFQEAAERETATAELARRVVRFLYRARYDQDLQFTTL